MLKVKFKVLDLADLRSDGSELEVGNVYEGKLNWRSVYYTDKTGDEWIFYVGVTCEIVEEL